MLTKKNKIIFAVMGVCSRFVDKSLKPYEDVITKVNGMLGSNMVM